MSVMQSSVLRALQLAFSERIVQGSIAPHDCPECAAIRQALAGHSWQEIPNAFAEKFSGSLPLLTPDAYNAYLPIWLRAAVEYVNGEAAAMVPINLTDEPSKLGFTPPQRKAIIAVVDFIATNNWCGPDDPDNIKYMSDVRIEWAEVPPN